MSGYVGFVIVIISTFIICSMCFQKIDYGNTCGEGDKLGVCKKFVECDSAVKAVEKERGHPYQRCDFIGKEEIICCPDFHNGHSGQPQSNKNGLPDDGRVWGSSTIKPIYTKSQKACEEYTKETKQSLHQHIIGGVDAKLNEFPHMAQIGFDDPDLTGWFKWNCGGSLIHPRFVLTAAHCVSDANDPPKIVRCGFVDSLLPGESKVVERYVRNHTLHPEYDALSGVNDIALIQLRQEITRNDNNVYPACLYQTNDDPKELIITGWGDTESGDAKNSRILQIADVEPSDFRKCVETYARVRNITERHICCLNPNSTADTCQGDSGGPLQRISSGIKNVYAIVGVTSFGIDCGDGRTPGVYTRVSSYIKWIESIVWT